MSEEKIVDEVIEEESSEPKEISEVLEETVASMRAGDVDEEPTPEPVEQGSEEAPIETEEDFEASLSERAQDRFRELTERAKAAEESAAQTRAQGADLYKIMLESGVTPDDLTAYFEYHKASRSGNTKAAQPYWENLERTHSDFTGQRVGDADPLSRYPDLQKSVEDLDVTEDKARELASLRDYAQRAQEYEQRQAAYHQQNQEQQRQQEEAAHYASRASAELDNWSDQKKATDPDWEQKEALLLERAQDVFPQLHPAHWPAWAAREYDYLSKAFPSRQNGTSPNPIRPGVSGKSAEPEPKNISEALDQALKDMRT